MSPAKRILLLVTQAHWGGVQSFLIQFAEELLREGHTVLLAAGGEGTLFEEAKRRGIPTTRLKKIQREIRPLADWRAIHELVELYQEFKPDAVHLNSSKMGVLGSLAAQQVARKGLRPRIVYRIGGWAFLEPLPRWKQWFYHIAEQWSARVKDIIITVHPMDEQRARALRILPREQVITVPNGIDVAAFVSQLLPRNEARATLELPRHAFVIGLVANAYPTKGLLPYLEVAQRLCQEDRHVLHVIIGSGPEFEALMRKRDERGLRDCVKLAGERHDATTLYAAFDLFVLPSLKEGMPWTLLEAMASGIPSIATDVGACRWMLQDAEYGNAGVIVPAQNLLVLHDAVRALKNDPERRAQYARAARRIVTQRFTWKRTFQGNRDALMHPFDDHPRA